jgi:integrase
MENNKLLNNQSDAEEFELAILQAQIDKIQQETKQLELKSKIYEDHLNKKYAAISKRVGYIVDASNIDSINLPQKTWGEILDEIYDKQDCLIRPSHCLMPYSLVKQKPELQDYIPAQKATTVVELLMDKSTTRAFEIIKEHSSENTYRAYLGDLIYWQAWLSAIGFSFFEHITEREVITFIVQHAEGLDPAMDEKLVAQHFKNKIGPHKLATIKRRIASLSVFLESSKWPNPCKTKEVKQLLFKLTKKYGSSKPAGKAITKDILDDMLDTCKEKLIDIRDKALLLFAWGSGGRRRAEVASANMKDLTKTPDGEFIYLIPQSKTDQEGNGHPVPVKGRVAKALQDWLNASGVNDGGIFRAVKKGGKVGRQLSDVDVFRIVRIRLKLAGYDETQFGAHSLRSGFVTEAGRRNKPLGDVMALTTHRNVGTVMKYYQAGNIINNSASNLAD